MFPLLKNSDAAVGIGKDSVYRLMNSATVNWRRFLLLLSTRVIVQKSLPLIDEATVKVLIADNTLYSRDQEIFKERDRKLEAARELRKQKRHEVHHESNSSLGALPLLTQVA